MEFEVRHLGYFQRIIRGIFINILLAIVLFLYFYSKTNHMDLIGTIIPLFILVFSYVRFEQWYRFYITKVMIHQKTVSVEIYDRNKKRECIFKLEDIDLILDKTFTYGSFYKLTFKEKGVRKFVQYQYGGWKREKILKLYKDLNNAKRNTSGKSCTWPDTNM